MKNFLFPQSKSATVKVQRKGFDQRLKELVKKSLNYRLLEEPGKFYGYDRRALRELRDVHAGKRCFVIGNGPSLNKIDLSKLEKEYSFGVNGIFYKTRETGFAPTYYVVEDTHVLKDNIAAIEAYADPKIKFFPSLYKPYIKNRERVLFFNMNRGFYEPKSPNYHIPRFSTDISERIYCGQSVTMINLQIAYYMGFTEVYLIGMDFSYQIPSSAIVSGKDIESTDDDPNHFHPDYFGKGKKWHDPQLDMVLLNYRFIKLVYESHGRKIFNATKGGKLEEFKRVDYEALFV